MNAPAGAEGLSLVGVGKDFRSADGLVHALADVTLRVGRGRFVTVIGPSGCGKSTLLRLAAGLLEPDTGTVSVLGGTLDEARAHKRIGFVPQSPALLAWRSVLENVELVLEVNRRPRPPGARRPEELLGAFGLGGVLDRRPAELSGGMQQRVAVARAFALAPDLLLMDEPFSALDELTRDLLRHELLDQWEADRATVVFVTHSVSEAVLLSDHVVVLSSGPGRVAAELEIDLERPRGEGIEFTDRFRDLELEVRDALGKVWGRAR